MMGVWACWQSDSATSMDAIANLRDPHNEAIQQAVLHAIHVDAILIWPKSNSISTIISTICQCCHIQKIVIGQNLIALSHYVAAGNFHVHRRFLHTNMGRSMGLKQKFPFPDKILFPATSLGRVSTRDSSPQELTGAEPGIFCVIFGI